MDSKASSKVAWNFYCRFGNSEKCRRNYLKMFAYKCG